MLCASGIEYNAYSGVIESVVRTYVNIKRTNVPDMNDDDVSQEIRMKCWVALHSETFDVDRYPSPYSYLNRTIHNYLYNLRRGTIVPNNGPCNRCDFWDRELKTCKSDDGICDKYQQYKQNMQIKLALKNPVGYDKQYIENTVTYVDLSEDSDVYDLEEYVIYNLPIHLRHAYNLLRSGVEIDEDIRDEVEESVREILKYKE